MDEDQAPPKIMSYADFLDKYYPSLPDEDGNKDEEREAQRATMTEKFARPGGPGVRFKTHLDKLYKCLTLTKGAKEELGIQGDEGLAYDDEAEKAAARARVEKLAEDEELDPEKEAEYERQRFERMMNAELFGDGFYHLIPSFYRTLMYLKK